MTHSLLLSVVGLRKKKTRGPQKWHNEFFYNIVRLNGTNGWKFLVYLGTMLYVPIFLPLQHCQKSCYTHPALSIRWLLNPNFEKKANENERLQTYLLISLNSLLIGHQIQISKNGKYKRSRHFQFLHCNILILTGVCSNFLPFFVEFGKIYNYF